MRAERPDFEIVVLTQARVLAYPLVTGGTTVVGRADADINIDDASISRRHAAFHVTADGKITIEDLGSSNGTRFRQGRGTTATERLIDVGSCPGRRAEIAPGNLINIGLAPVVVRRREPPAEDVGTGIVVTDPAMRSVYDLAERVAKGPINILLLGETGVGKEILAESIHRFSPRKDRPFLRLSCVALSESLLESELFGHERGAFTGAVRAKPGLLETAEGGTVFLDEIGELPQSVQAKLLRVIEERKVLRVGGLQSKSIDVRFVSATNRDLEVEIARGAFRQDLYFRLNGVALMIPPLRDRRSEIETLARLFAARAAAQLDDQRKIEISPAALGVLQRHSWPGNIRELRNVIERAVILTSAGTLEPEHLLLKDSEADAAPAPPAVPQSSYPPPPANAAKAPVKLREAMDAHERERIVAALEQCGGNQTRAAAVLGISRRTLVDRLREYNIPRPRKQ